MVQKRKRRSEKEWIELIQQCRNSGLSDKNWCESNGIERSQFYRKIKELREKAVSIPNHSVNTSSPRQEVVEIRLDQTVLAPEKHKLVKDAVSESPAIRISLGTISLEISNHAAADTIVNTLSALRMLC